MIATVKLYYKTNILTKQKIKHENYDQSLKAVARLLLLDLSPRSLKYKVVNEPELLFKKKLVCMGYCIFFLAIFSD